MKKLFVMAFLLVSSLSLLQAAVKHPSFTLTDINGANYEIKGKEEGLDIKGMEGKIVFLEFFGHKCPPCLASIPHLINFQSKYKDRVVVMSVEVQGFDNEKLSAFAKEKGMNYILFSEEAAGDFVNYISQRAEWNGGIPFLVVIDEKGDVQFIQAGMLPEGAYDEIVRQLTPAADQNVTAQAPATPAPVSMPAAPVTASENNQSK
ncbi:MAG: TlpA family protein disulfide reductase [Campylobacterales bacterium]|nr:TlpA family protein disulfide reductase [Campylobacterales bacterium]